jgi:hypothetical protein
MVMKCARGDLDAAQGNLEDEAPFSSLNSCSVSFLRDAGVVCSLDRLRAPRADWIVRTACVRDVVCKTQ